MSAPHYGDFAEDDTVDMIFNTFTSDDPSASCTITNFINTDVHIHKDGGLTQRNNAAGITVSVDFDGITGNHLVKIDTSDDTVAGFWVTGSEYQVRIEGTTIDGATVNGWIGSFSIERAGGALALLKNATYGLSALESLVDDIGAAGAGLTAIPWNSDWDTEVQSEVQDALEANNLDHLCKTATGGADMTSEVVDNSILSRILANGDTSAFDPSTDGLQPLRDHVGDGTNLSEAGGDGDHLTAVPWNSNWDTEVESEVQDAIEVNNLDHLMKVAVSNRDTMPEVVDDTVLANLMTKTDGDTSDFDHATDSLEAIRDRGDSEWITATGFSTHSAADIWNATIDEATAGATPTTAKGKLQAIWNRLFTKKTVTSSAETSYESDDTTEMESWTLADDDTTASRTR